MHYNPDEYDVFQDLQEYLDTSSNGVVYFSLGTHVASSSLDNKTLEEIIHALSELPFNVLWKWEKDSLPNQPSNVLIRKFFPQQDLLGKEVISKNICKLSTSTIHCEEIFQVSVP